MVTIDFEDIATSGLGQGGQTLVGNQYSGRGVAFVRGVPVIDYSKGQAVPGFAHSGTRAIQQCYGVQFCTWPVEAQFRVPQTRVKVWVGYAQAQHGAGSIMLLGNDASSTTIVRKSIDVPASLTPTAIRQSLEVSVAEPRIYSIQVMALGQLLSRGLAVDDLEFETTNTRPLPPPRVEKAPEKPPVALSLKLVSKPVTAGEQASFTVSIEGTGPLPRFVFDAGDGSEKQTLSVGVIKHTYKLAATSLTASVVPADGSGPAATVDFDVEAPPPPPISLKLELVSSGGVGVGEPASFAVSVQGGGAVPSYVVTIGDGSASQTRRDASFTHAFEKAGRFAVSVKPPPGVAGTGSTVVVTVAAPTPIWIYAVVVLAVAAAAYGVRLLLRPRKRAHVPAVVTLHPRQRMPPQFTPEQQPRPASPKTRTFTADPAATLRGVFDDLKTDSLRVTLADDAAVAAAVSAQLDKVQWHATAAELLPKVAELLDVELSRVFAVFWQQAKEIGPALEESRKSPNVPIQAPLTDCSTDATLEPLIEIRFGGTAPPKRILITVTLPLTFRAVALTIRAGSVVGVAAGECHMDAEVELGAATLAKLKEPVAIALAGWPVPLDH